MLRLLEAHLDKIENEPFERACPVCNAELHGRGQVTTPDGLRMCLDCYSTSLKLSNGRDSTRLSNAASTCPICLCDLQKQSKGTVVTPCGHGMCVGCFGHLVHATLRARRGGVSCPQCRSMLYEFNDQNGGLSDDDDDNDDDLGGDPEYGGIYVDGRSVYNVRVAYVS